MTIPEAFELAVEHHRAGRLPAAEAIYRRILAADPRHADSLHHLGIIAHQVGRHDIAVDLILRAVASEPDNPAFHSNLAEAYRKLGRVDDAIAACRRSLQINPNLPEVHNNLGNALADKRQSAEAAVAYRRALALRPDYAEARYNLGNALRDHGSPDEAVAEYHRALALRPDYADAYTNLGNVLLAQERFDGAIAAFLRVVELRPDFAEGHFNLASALREQGRAEEAVAAVRTALRLKPDSPDWRYLLAALTGQDSPCAAPASYVRGLFDNYATRFDEHLIGRLNYSTPERLLDAVLKVAPGRRFDILDLGCGTGLCGAKFSAHAKTLVGVDLAPKMIEKAAARGIYDRLVPGDLLEAMRDQADNFDLVLAGDVFVYLGDLAATFASAANALRDGGLFVFSLERHDGEGFVLHSKMRFAHSRTYIRELSHKHSLAELNLEEVVLRKEREEDVRGWIVVLKKSAAAGTPLPQ